MFKKNLTIIVFFLFLFSEVNACKIWAVISKEGYPLTSLNQEHIELIQVQLNSFYNQSQSNANGWSVIQYGRTDLNFDNNVYRSVLPAYQDSSNYWNTMESIFNDSSDNISIAHLRAATSGASSIPNPHPWIFEGDSTYSFVHNGGASKDILYDLITENGLDEDWLIQNPPQTYGNGDWSADGWSSVVDSELIMLLIMKKIVQSQSVIEGLESAVTMMLDSGIYPSMLNFIFSDSKSLFIYGGNSGLKIMETDEYFSVMSSPPTDTQSQSWDPINSNELVVINKESINRYPTFASVSNDDPNIVFPDSPKLFSPYPNPFNGRLTINFDVGISQSATISIYSINGIKVFSKSISHADKNRGRIYWNPKNNFDENLSSGLYIVELSSEVNSTSSKIMFIK